MVVSLMDGSNPQAQRRGRTKAKSSGIPANRKDPQNGRASSRRPGRYSRWRAATLVGVYLLMTAHIVHWKLAGRTLAPLELNEVMYTLELGILTAGFIFMVFAMLATLAFGRFFCSWGCHILALEDLCAWLLSKVRIRPSPIRSRTLAWVPLGAMLYMFVWPQVLRLLAGRSLPYVKVNTDAQGWASFLTTNFWRNLPSPWVAVLTFAVCGFAMVYVLGSRAFCTYGCPYGVLFGLADRFAPGRIVAQGDCAQCGICTAVCQSHVRVHEEAQRFGRIVNPACLKDLDCVAVCPNGALRYGLAWPSIFAGHRSAKLRPKPYDLSLGEDLFVAVTFLAALLIFRGLYEAIPFLMTLAIGGILGYFGVLVWRLLRRRHVRLNNLQFKLDGRLTGRGRLFVGFAGVLAAFTAHSAFIRYHEFLGGRRYDDVQALAGAGRTAPREAIDEAIRHLAACDRWGLVWPDRLAPRLAALHLTVEEPESAAPYLRRALAPPAVNLLSAHEQARLNAAFGELLVERGDFVNASRYLQRACALTPSEPGAHYNLAVALAASGQPDDAIAAYRQTIALNPTDADAYNNLGLLLAQRGELTLAEAGFRKAIELKVDFAHPHFNLGRVLEALGRMTEARDEYQAAAKLDPTYAEILSNRRMP